MTWADRFVLFVVATCTGAFAALLIGIIEGGPR